MILIKHKKFDECYSKVELNITGLMVVFHFVSTNQSGWAGLNNPSPTGSIPETKKKKSLDTMLDALLSLSI